MRVSPPYSVNQRSCCLEKAVAPSQKDSLCLEFELHSKLEITLRVCTEEGR